jgi:hypothetical protein
MEQHVSFGWMSGRLLHTQLPELFSFVREQNLPANSFLSMADASDMADLFHLPLSSQAYAQFQQLNAIIADTPLQQSNDTWSYIWGSNIFASSKAYLSFNRHKASSSGLQMFMELLRPAKKKILFLAPT